MQIVCPKCKTVLQIKDGKIPEKKVAGKCAQCGTRLIIDPYHLKGGAREASASGSSEPFRSEEASAPARDTSAPTIGRGIPVPGPGRGELVPPPGVTSFHSLPGRDAAHPEIGRGKTVSTSGRETPSPVSAREIPIPGPGRGNPTAARSWEKPIPAPGWERPATSQKRMLQNDLVKACPAWKRVVASLVDMALVAGATFAVTIVLPKSIQTPGLPILGLYVTLALIYFGVSQSSCRKGQTFGKHITGIRVLDEEGAPLSLARSALRFVLLALPPSLAILALPPKNASSAIDAALTAAFLGICFVDAYLLFFGGPMRQSLHDLLLGTYVVDAVKTGRVSREALWNGHARIA